MWGLRAQIKELREALEQTLHTIETHQPTQAVQYIKGIAKEALDKR